VSYLLAGVWLCANLAAAAPLAHSAQVTLEGSTSAAGLSLTVRPTAADGTLKVTGVSVAAGGRSVPATRQADGSWLAPLAGSAAAAGPLEVTVDHDGIREVLSGQLPAPAAGAAPSALRGNHGQMAWWILNIAVVLIAVLAISRRMS
jgi:hypothetical protein